MVQIFDEISNNLKFVKNINNVLNGKFIEEIQPILDLKLWRKLNYFSDKDDDVIKFTIIKTLAIMVKGDCWQKQDEHDNLDYNYNIESSLIEFANKFLDGEYKHSINKLIEFFELFDDYICEDGISYDLQNFLDDCNLSHAVLVIEQYHISLADFELNTNDLPFVDILDDFTYSKRDYDYIDDEYSNDLGYDRRFADVYVNDRQESIDDFFLRYIENYFTEISEEEEEEDDDND